MNTFIRKTTKKDTHKTEPAEKSKDLDLTTPEATIYWDVQFNKDSLTTIIRLLKFLKSSHLIIPRAIPSNFACQLIIPCVCLVWSHLFHFPFYFTTFMTWKNRTSKGYCLYFTDEDSKGLLSNYLNNSETDYSLGYVSMSPGNQSGVFCSSSLNRQLLLLLSNLSRVRPCATPALGFPRREHWSGLPLPSPMRENEKWKRSHSAMSDSSRPHGLQPTRLLCPWDFPGKSTGVGCHCLLHWIGKAQWKVKRIRTTETALTTYLLISSADSYKYMLSKPSY